MIAASIPRMPRTSPFTSSVEAPLASLVSGFQLARGLEFTKQYEGAVIIPSDPVTRFRRLSCLTAAALLLGLAVSCLLILLQDYKRHAIMYVMVLFLSALCSSRLIDGILTRSCTTLGRPVLCPFHSLETNGIFPFRSRGTSSSSGPTCMVHW